MVNIRGAKTGEYSILSDIAFKSEAYWGYDSDYMNNFKSIYSVSKEFINNNPTVVIEDCEDLGIKEFNIVTSPQAKEFYVKMGAIPCGEIESLLKKGRIIPQLVYIIEK